MIEVTQKDLKGRIQTRGTYTEVQFGYAYRYHHNDIMEMFSFEHKMIGRHEEAIEGYDHRTRTVADFTLVAYNGKGNVLDPTYLLGLARESLWQNRRHYWWGVPGTKRNRHRGSGYKQIHTTPERRATFACEDQEVYTPKVRCTRNLANLPNTWDDYWRFNQKNWKKFRSHQWKD